jgi:hypothetical protein
MTQMNGKSITVMQVDLRTFTLNQFFYMVHNNAISLKPNNKNSRSLMKRAIKNYYAVFKLFSRRDSRAFILNAIFIYELCISVLPIVDIVSLINQLLNLANYEQLSELEVTKLQDTYFIVSNSLEHGTLEKLYPGWLRKLHENYCSSEALLVHQPIIERQMLGFGGFSPDIQNLTDSVQELNTKMPNEEDKNKFFELIERLPNKHHYADFLESVGVIGNSSKELPALNDNIRAMTAGIHEAMNRMDAVTESVSTKFDKAKDFSNVAKDVLCCSLTAWCLYKYYKDKSKLNLTMLTAAGALTVYYGTSNECKTFVFASGVMSLIHLFQSDKTEDDKLERQSFTSDFTDTANAFISFMTSIKWSALPRKILDCIRLTKDLPEFLEGVLALIKGFINSIWTTFFKVPLFTETGLMSSSYNAEFDRVMTAFVNGNLEHSFSEAKMVQRLIDQTTVYLNECKKIGDRKILDSNWRILLDIRKELVDVRYSYGGSRQEPVVVMIQGTPGTKKTVWLRHLSEALVRHFKPHLDDTSTEIYSKPAGDFWSEYKNQFITCMDDFGQIRDSLGDPREKGDLINMYNTIPFPLNMNNNEDKGKVYFSSEFVLLTANSGWQNAESLLSEQALKRRIDIDVSIHCNGNAKPVNGTGIELMDPKNYSFIVKFRNNDAQTMDLSGLLTTCVSQYRIKQAHYKVFKKVQNELVGETNLNKTQEEVLAAQLSEVEAKMDEMLARNNADKCVKQSGFSEVVLDDEESIIMEAIEIEKKLNGSLWIKDLPDFRQRIPPIINGEKIYDDQKFLCDFYPDMAELEHSAAITLLKKACPIKQSSMYDLTQSDKQFLSLHFGEKRTEVFMLEYQIARQKFGKPNIALLRMIVDNTTRTQRGYYLTEMSLLMSIWMQDRIKFYDVFRLEQPTIEDMVHYRGFQEYALLSDWKLACRRTNKRIREYFSRTQGSVHAIITNIENGISERISQTFGMNISQEGVHKFLTIAATLTSISLLAIPIIRYTFKLVAPAKTSEQSYFVKTEGKEKGAKLSLRNAIKEAAAQRQSSSIIPMLTKIERSSAMFSIKNGEEQITVGKVFFINTDTLLLPLHFYEDILAFPKAQFIIDDGESQLILGMEHFVDKCSTVETAELELALVRSDMFKKTRKDQIESFVTRDTLNKMTSKFQVSLFPYTENVMISGSAHIGKLTYESKTVDKMIKYNIDTGKGDCGSMIYLMNPNVGKGVICGMHEAGTSKGNADKTAAAYILTKEDLIEALAELDPPEEEIECQGNSLTSQFSHSPYGYSKIVKSPFVKQGELIPTKIPARLYPDKERNIDPMDICLAKYKPYPKDIHTETLLKARTDVADDLTSFEYIPHYGSKVPFDIAFFGDPFNSYMKAIPTSTSSGFPYKFVDRDIKKLIKDEGPDGDKFKEFTKHLERLEKKLDEGVRPHFIYTSNLKDQTISIEKAKAGGGRIFFGTPLDLCVLKKAYFGEFVIFMQIDCVAKGTAMSINPHSTDWKDISRRLSSHSLTWKDTICRDFDYSHFDGSNNPEVLNEILWIINSWYTHHGMGQHNHIRETLFEEISDFWYIRDNSLIQMGNSLPSGSFLTLLVNCLTNKVLMRYAFYRNFDDLSYNDYMVDIVQGDDNVVAIHRELAEKFSPVHIAEAVSELGFTITLGDKTSVTSEWSNLDECTFLKRRFVKDQYGIVRAPLMLETLWNTMCWTKKGYLYHQILIDNITFFYREASQHGEQVYNQETMKLRQVLTKFPDFNMYPKGKLRPWRDWDREVRKSPFFSQYIL